MFDEKKSLCQFTNEELKDLMSCVERELEVRRNSRREYLVQAVCDAMNTLYREFPGIELNVPYSCPECSIEDEVDAMYVLCSGREMKPGDFGIW